MTREPESGAATFPTHPFQRPRTMRATLDGNPEVTRNGERAIAAEELKRLASAGAGGLSGAVAGVEQCRFHWYAECRCRAAGHLGDVSRHPSVKPNIINPQTTRGGELQRRKNFTKGADQIRVRNAGERCAAKRQGSHLLI